MRQKQQSGGTVIEVNVGYAADEAGNGVAYAAIGAAAGPRLVRVPFRVRRHHALKGREVGYVALREVAESLLSAGNRHVRFLVDDETLAADLSERRPVPAALTVPYVALRCRLNRFDGAEVAHAPSGATSDLRARALAEVSLRVAA
jgi:hypothetical protein